MWAPACCYLASRRRIAAPASPLSPVQAAAAEARIRAQGLDEHLTCLEGDYNRLPDGLGADAAYAIESFVHGATPERFFAESARILAPSGALFVCDDFLADAESRA